MINFAREGLTKGAVIAAVAATITLSAAFVIINAVVGVT